MIQILTCNQTLDRLNLESIDQTKIELEQTEVRQAVVPCQQTTLSTRHEKY